MAPTAPMPAPHTETLKNPPLELVVCQIRHEPLGPSLDPKKVLALQATFGNGFSKLEPQMSAEINFGPMGIVPPNVTQTAGWKLSTPAGGWSVVLTPDSFAIESSKYTTWSEFRTLLSDLIDAVLTVFDPKIVQRVGVRYVDRMWRAGSQKPSDWNGLLSGAILGFAGIEETREAVLALQTHCEFSLGDYRAVMRSSLAPDTTPSKFSMVLDTDCFDERSQSFEADAVRSTIDDLHTLCLQLFQQVVTEQYLEEMRG